MPNTPNNTSNYLWVTSTRSMYTWNTPEPLSTVYDHCRCNHYTVPSKHNSTALEISISPGFCHPVPPPSCFHPTVLPCPYFPYLLGIQPLRGKAEARIVYRRSGLGCQDRVLPEFLARGDIWRAKQNPVSLDVGMNPGIICTMERARTSYPGCSFSDCDLPRSSSESCQRRPLAAKRQG